jgi:plasmid stability protein
VKTTIELPDELFREAKATAARRGTSLKEFVREALADRLARENGSEGQTTGVGKFPVPPPDIPSEEIWRVQAIIDAEFDEIEPEDRA